MPIWADQSTQYRFDISVPDGKCYFTLGPKWARQPSLGRICLSAAHAGPLPRNNFRFGRVSCPTRIPWLQSPVLSTRGGKSLAVSKFVRLRVVNSGAIVVALFLVRNATTVVRIGIVRLDPDDFCEVGDG